MMATYNEEDPELRPQRVNYITERWDQLNRLTKEFAEKAIGYLFVTNAGGAAAILSFLGADPEIRTVLFPKAALGFFGVGILCVGLLLLRMYHHAAALFEQWRKFTGLYYDNRMDYKEMTAADDQLAYNVIPELILGYASFLCFIAGSLIGVVGLFNVWSKP